MVTINTKDYKYEADMFEEYLKSEKLELMKQNKNEYDIAKTISNISIKKNISKDFDNFNNTFINSINILGKRTTDFFQNTLPKLKIVRSNSLKHGEAFLIGYEKQQNVVITDKPLKDIDYVTYSHELGHVPQMIKKVPNEYYEYIEAYPILLEYLACKEINPQNAFELFKSIRFNDTKDMATLYLKYQREIRNNGSHHDRYFETQKREVMKYIISLELALKLIDRIENDSKKTLPLLEKYVMREKSMKEVGTSLGIDTTGCKKLIRVATKK